MIGRKFKMIGGVFALSCLVVACRGDSRSTGNTSTLTTFLSASSIAKYQ